MTLGGAANGVYIMQDITTGVRPGQRLLTGFVTCDQAREPAAGHTVDGTRAQPVTSPVGDEVTGQREVEGGDSL